MILCQEDHIKPRGWVRGAKLSISQLVFRFKKPLSNATDRNVASIPKSFEFKNCVNSTVSRMVNSSNKFRCGNKERESSEESNFLLYFAKSRKTFVRNSRVILCNWKHIFSLRSRFNRGSSLHPVQLLTATVKVAWMFLSFFIGFDAGQKTAVVTDAK
jgi:hypothetical protein